MADVSVIIVNYNTKATTLRCLELLDRSRSDVDFDVVLVDNASADGSAEAIAAELPAVRLLRLDTNVGFGRAVNRAVMMVDTPYVMLLNPDAEPVGPVVDRLLGFARARPGHGLYTGRSLRGDGTDDRYSCWGLPTLWSMVCFASGLSAALPSRAWANPEGLPAYDLRTACEVPAVSGCVLLIERDLFLRIGGFDPRYFLYSEDIDLSLRATAAGARPILCPDAVVVHAVGGSSSSVNQRVLLLRGKATYLRQHWSPVKARVGLALLRTGIAIRALEAIVRPRRASADFRAVWRERRVWTAGYPACDDSRPQAPVAAAEPAGDRSLR